VFARRHTWELLDHCTYGPFCPWASGGDLVQHIIFVTCLFWCFVILVFSNLSKGRRTPPQTTGFTSSTLYYLLSMFCLVQPPLFGPFWQRGHDLSPHKTAPLFYLLSCCYFLSPFAVVPHPDPFVPLDPA